VTATTSLADGPLSGLRVVEFGQLIAGPYVGTLLADFGARRHKVEAPPKGDALREWGRHRHNDHALWRSVIWAARHTAEELDRIVNEAGVVCAPVSSVADVYDDPYVRERELIVEIDDDVHGPMSAPGVVPKLTATPGRIREPARWEVGADTSDVLGDLEDEVEGLDLPRREGAA
jgi:crotonobetainyl-CoA:carnitine CoA-transferase CaiB-like acyl-CoA transferase